MMNNLQCALHYSRQGLRIFPTQPNIDLVYSKGTAGYQLMMLAKDRPLTESEIREFWTRFPDANIACYGGSGISVLDVDTKNIKTGHGFKTLVKQGRQDVLNNGMKVITPSGSIHLYFKETKYLPEHFNSNESNPLGLDIRNDTNYFFWLPPSHMWGYEKYGSYAFEYDMNPLHFQVSNLPEFPYKGDWFLANCGRSSSQTTTALRSNRKDGYDPRKLAKDGFPKHGGVKEVQQQGYYLKLSKAIQDDDKIQQKLIIEETFSFIQAQDILHFKCRCSPKQKNRKGHDLKHPTVLVQPSANNLLGLSGHALYKTRGIWYPLVWGQHTALKVTGISDASKEILELDSITGDVGAMVSAGYYLYPRFVWKHSRRQYKAPAWLRMRTDRNHTFTFDFVEKRVFPVD